MGADAHDATGFASQAAMFKSQGYSFVAQYIDQFSDANTGGSPSVTQAQIQQDTAAGLNIVSIFQTNGMSSSAGNGYQTYFTGAQGTADAQEALTSAANLGQPAGSAVYFAMDFDPAVFGAAGSEANLLSAVRTYLGAVSTAFDNAGYSVGVYGAGDTLAAAIRTSPPVATYGWLTQSYGWAGSNPQTDANAQGWDIYQAAQTTQNGVAIDPDTATSDTFGSWTVCYCGGTKILTTRGDVSVEALRSGDLVVTASGEQRPIRWTGHRELDGAGTPLPHDQQPVRVSKGAFGPGLPARDLRLSPGHPVLVGQDADNGGGHLVPIMCLINGTSIRREPATRVTYWHVELDSHDILLAEGLPAESYLDWGDRPFFDEASDHALHNPDFIAPGLSARCRPVAIEGAVVDAERTRLGAVFAAELAAHCAWDQALGLDGLAA